MKYKLDISSSKLLCRSNFILGLWSHPSLFARQPPDSDFILIILYMGWYKMVNYHEKYSRIERILFIATKNNIDCGDTVKR